MPDGSPMLVIKGPPADYDTQDCHLIIVSIWISYFSLAQYCGNTRPRVWPFLYIHIILQTYSVNAADIL